MLSPDHDANIDPLLQYHPVANTLIQQGRLWITPLTVDVTNRSLEQGVRGFASCGCPDDLGTCKLAVIDEA